MTCTQNMFASTHGPSTSTSTSTQQQVQVQVLEICTRVLLEYKYKYQVLQLIKASLWVGIRGFYPDTFENLHISWWILEYSQSTKCDFWAEISSLETGSIQRHRHRFRNGGGAIIRRRAPKIFSGVPTFMQIPPCEWVYVPDLFACGRCTNRPIGLMLTDDGNISYNLAKKRNFLQG